MRPDKTPGREHGVTDLLILLAAVMLALATWSCLSNANGVPVWKSYISVVTTLLLALASLTRNPEWAVRIRMLTGGFLFAAPYLLKFQDIAPALWTYLVAGVAVTVLAIPRIGRAQLAM